MCGNALETMRVPYTCNVSTTTTTLCTPLCTDELSVHVSSHTDIASVFERELTCGLTISDQRHACEASLFHRLFV
jgi:hypothetical protein